MMRSVTLHRKVGTCSRRNGNAQHSWTEFADEQWTTRSAQSSSVDRTADPQRRIWNLQNLEIERKNYMHEHSEVLSTCSTTSLFKFTKARKWANFIVKKRKNLMYRWEFFSLEIGEWFESESPRNEGNFDEMKKIWISKDMKIWREEDNIWQLNSE